MGDVEDSDDSLPTTAGRTLITGSRRKTTSAERWAENWDVIKLYFWMGVLLAIVGGIGYGIYAGAIWAKDQFDGADKLTQRASACYADAEKQPWRMEECDKLAARADSLRQREQAAQSRHEAEQFCKDKGLRFKGTIGNQTECEP